jgi:AraC-like DNA-binding protein
LPTENGGLAERYFRRRNSANNSAGRNCQAMRPWLNTRRSNSAALRAPTLRMMLLADGDCTVERVAEHFGCTRRTIHRHLGECGTSFSEILDAERADLALRLIEDRSRPLAAVAEMLGFSAQSAMARWFKGRFGRSVTSWRSDAREQALAALRRW